MRSAASRRYAPVRSLSAVLGGPVEVLLARKCTSLVAILLVLGSAAEAGSQHWYATTVCGVRLLLPVGWTPRGEDSWRGSCEVQLRPPGWKPDPECPERVHGRVLMEVVPKRLQKSGRGSELKWLRTEPTCDSGWYATDEMGSCLYPIHGRASALSAQTTSRSYCNGTYTALDLSSVGVVFGESRLVFANSDIGDREVFDQIVGSMRP